MHIFITIAWRKPGAKAKILCHPAGGVVVCTPSLDSKVYGRQKRGVKILCVAAELKNRGQKSICGHKKGGQYSMSH